MARILLILGLFGTLTSTVYLIMVLSAVLRFRRRRKIATGITPPLSLLKPLHGAEPGLYEYLESFFHQDYADYEIIFCARHEDDAGLAIARTVAAKYPHIETRILTCGEPSWPNAKCFSLAAMSEAAKHDILVVTDSDVRVAPDYLRAVVAPFGDEKVGLVTCIYRGVATEKGLWARLEGLGMSIEMTSGVLVADMLEGMKFALGPSMAVRKRCVVEIGGFRALGDYYADDFVLGNLVAAHGNVVVLSDHVIDHCVVNTKFRNSIEHQRNWAKSTRFSRPKGHLGTGLTFSVAFGIMAFVAAMILGKFWLGMAVLGWTILFRILQSAVVGLFAVQDWDAVTWAWMYPLRDLMGSFFWASSYFSQRAIWRGDPYRLKRGGLVELLSTADRQIETR
jgi:ceramide glucosyltransferase